MFPQFHDKGGTKKWNVFNCLEVVIAIFSQLELKYATV